LSFYDKKISKKIEEELGKILMRKKLKEKNLRNFFEETTFTSKIKKKFK